MTVVAPVTGTYREYPFEAFVEANGSPPEQRCAKSTRH